MSALRPHGVWLDLRLPDIPGCEVCRRVKRLPDPPAVLVFTSFADDQRVLESISAGADGYLLKDFEQTELANSIVRVAEGGSLLDPLVARKLLGVARQDGKGLGSLAAGGTARTERLSPQEQRILTLLAEGLPNKEIASALKLGDGTVRNHLTAIFTQLGVENRTEAVALWLRR